MPTPSELLLLSSSRVGNSGYLEHAGDLLTEHFGTREILFIPYAGVTMSYPEYTAKVAAALAQFGLRVRGIESYDDPVAAVVQAEAIAVGGGNTFHLLKELYQHQLIAAIQTAVAKGTPYAGWSAGSNIAGMSIRTTNDMPIVEPPSFEALQLVPFQLNPHYTDYQPPGFHGETRDQRLEEFMTVAPTMPVLAIREGTGLKVSGDTMTLKGPHDGCVFLAGTKSVLSVNSDCSTLLTSK